MATEPLDYFWKAQIFAKKIKKTLKKQKKLDTELF